MLKIKQNKNTMGRNIEYKCLLPLVLFTVSVLLQGCKDDVFNPEKVKAAYQDRFPVKDIDPAMDWKMTMQVRINISVHEDAGADYTICIYDKNPLADNSTAKLLVEGAANNQLSFSTIMDCPSTLTYVFVCRTDANNRNVVKCVPINNNQINASFGSSAVTRAVATRSVKIPTIETYTPTRTAADMEALLEQAIEVSPNDYYEDYQAGGIYKISQGSTFTGTISRALDSSNPAILIIAGKWEPSGSIQLEDGYIVYILKDAGITLSEGSTFMMKGSTYFNIFEGGNITGAANSTIDITNASMQNYNYNAGTIDVQAMTNGGGGVFTVYNAPSGILKVPNYQCSTSGNRLINQGIAELGDTHDNLNLYNGGQLTLSTLKGNLINQGHATVADTQENCHVENGCYLNITGRFKGNLTLGDNCAATINEYPEVWNKSIALGNSCMINIDKASFMGTTFIGDTEPSLIKVNTLNNIQLSGNASQGNIYFEFQSFDNSLANDGWRNMNALTYFSKWGESPVLIPAGDCTGGGNTPVDSGSETPADPIPYTYVFEDNFPLVGDYDFNDVVLDVQTTHHLEKKTNHVKRIQLNVTLTAAGASKALGVGLRIVGISKSDIKEITTGGADRRFQASFNDPYNQFSYNSGTHMEDGDPNVVIPIAGEVHNVFGESPGTMVNTGGTGITAHIHTYEIIIELADQTKTAPLFSKDNLDFFICYQYKSMQQRMEVHLYEFWGYGATAAGTIQQENLDLAGNNTWAICVPYGFRYPIETINISRTDDPTASAYPDFIYWARDRSSSRDWYMNPVEANVYR